MKVNYKRSENHPLQSSTGRQSCQWAHYVTICLYTHVLTGCLKTELLQQGFQLMCSPCVCRHPYPYPSLNLLLGSHNWLIAYPFSIQRNWGMHIFKTEVIPLFLKNPKSKARARGKKYPNCSTISEDIFLKSQLQLKTVSCWPLSFYTWASATPSPCLSVL